MVIYPYKSRDANSWCEARIPPSEPVATWPKSNRLEVDAQAGRREDLVPSSVQNRPAAHCSAFASCGILKTYKLSRHSLPQSFLSEPNSMATQLSPSTKARRIPGGKLPCYVFDSGTELARHVARIVAAVIRERNALGQAAVLGLPTGSTPVGVYRELIRMHREDGLDFSHVETFNLDEYYGIGPDQLQSYRRWMREHFFDHVNIPERNIHIPDGNLPLSQVASFCADFESQIERAGGIDLMILGIGRNGHIGFNEPFSARESRTRLCTLDTVTRKSAASDFFGFENVPAQAITMGMDTILEAKKILLLALGEHKSSIIRSTVEGPVTERIPASFLQDHADVIVLADRKSTRLNSSH